MQRKYLLNRPNNHRLIIFFTGWSTDWHILDKIEIPDGYDLICCWDYRVINWLPLKKDYSEIIIIAWSFGIAATEYLLSTSHDLNGITGLYAINGSGCPIDDEKGIPNSIFDSTLKSLSEESLKKFRLRICGGKEKYNSSFSLLQTDLSVVELRQELEQFKTISKDTLKELQWDYAFISDKDRIFPPDNLKKAWSNTPYEVLFENAHLPNFQSLFNLIIKDKDNIGKKFEKTGAQYDENAFVQKGVSERLLEILEKLHQPFNNILEIGGGTGYLSNKIISAYIPEVFTMIDLAESNNFENIDFIKGDIEILSNSLPSDFYDLVLSGSTLQWLHSPSNVMREVKRSLKKGGYFLFSTFIKGNFKEIAALTDKSLLYLSEDHWRILAERAGFEIVETEIAQHRLDFTNVKDIFHHLKATGVNSLAGKNKTVGEIRNIMTCYPQENQKFSLTYVTLIMLLKKSYN